MTDTTTATAPLDVDHIALIRLIRGAFNGTNSWSDVGHKMKNLFVDNVVDPGEVFLEQFATDFGKAALAEAGKILPSVLAQVIANPSQTGSIIAQATPGIVQDLENAGITIAETDAIQDAPTVVANALRVQLTAAQTVAVTTPIQPQPNETIPNVQVASSPTPAVPSVAADTPAASLSLTGDPLPDNVAAHTLTPHD